MKNQITLILGRKGTGKTTYARNFIKDKKRLIIIDTLSEYNDYLVITDFESLYEYVNEHKDFQVSCQFTSNLDIDYLFKFVFLEQNICLLCEEISRYVSSYSRQSDNNPFSSLINFGRHKQIDIIGVARRPSEFSREFRAQVDTLISFQQVDKIDLQILESMGIYDADKLDPISDYKIPPKENINYKISLF